MSDVFLSYSRRDQAVVRRLHAALAETGREAWVDWEGIPPTAEWMAEVRAAVDAADAFVVILSPDWAASPVCREEAEHAASRGKRIVPVVVRDTDPASVPERVAALNWIFLRAGDDFGGGVATLLAALDLDLDWVHGHTRLLARAGEWEARGHERSLLLRGRDLQAAEALLAGAGANRDPQPTPLQAEYLYAARQAERRSGRIRTAGLAGGLVVALGLAAFAMVQLFRAEDQTRVAEARELAAAADARLTTDPELSVLLAIRAFERARVPDTERELRTAIGTSLIRARYEGHAGPVRAADFNADGSRMVTASDDGTARVWDTASHLPTLTLPLGGLWLTAAISPDGRFVAAGRDDGTITVHDSDSGVEQFSIQAHESALRSIRYDPAGQRIVSAGIDGRVAIWDATDGRLLVELPRIQAATHQDVFSAEFSPDGRSLVTAGPGRLARIWDATTGTLVRALVGHAEPVNDAAWSPNGSLIATASGDGTVRLWDAASGASIGVFRGHRDPVLSVDFDASGTRVLSAGADRTARVWSVPDGALLETLSGTQGTVLDAVFRPGGRRLVTLGSDATVREWAVGAVDPVMTLPPSTADAQVVDISPDGSRIVVAGNDLNVHLIDASTGVEIAALSGHARGVTRSVFSPDGATLLSGGLDGTVRLWDSRTGDPLLTLTGPQLHAAAFSSDGRLIVTGHEDGTVRVWDAYTGSPGAVIDVGRPVMAAVFSADASRVYSGDASGAIVEWDRATGERVAELGSHQDMAADLALSHDGRFLASVGFDGSLLVWDTRTQRLQRDLRGRSGTLSKVGFSPDDRLLVTNGDDGAAHVWDVASGTLLGDIRTDPAGVLSAVFTPGGDRILIANASLAAGIYPCDLCVGPDELLVLARSRVTRAFTPDERIALLHEPVTAPLPTSPEPSSGPDQGVATPAPSASLAADDICGIDTAPCELAPGVYRPRRFSPSLELAVTAPTVAFGQSAGMIMVSPVDQDNASLTFVGGPSAYGSENGSAVLIPQSSDGLIEYLRRTPGLTISDPEPVQVDGVSGQRFAVTSDATQWISMFFLDPYEWVFSPGSFEWIAVFDVGETDVIVIAEADSPAFEKTFDEWLTRISFPGRSPTPAGSPAP